MQPIRRSDDTQQTERFIHAGDMPLLLQFFSLKPHAMSSLRAY